MLELTFLENQCCEEIEQALYDGQAVADFARRYKTLLRVSDNMTFENDVKKNLQCAIEKIATSVRLIAHHKNNGLCIRHIKVNFDDVDFQNYEKYTYAEPILMDEDILELLSIGIESKAGWKPFIQGNVLYLQ